MYNSLYIGMEDGQKNIVYWEKINLHKNMCKMIQLLF